MSTAIEWTDETWNPITGCAKVSAGCKNCYAEGIAKRFWGDRDFGDVRMHEDRLDRPARWRRPRMVFVNSMSDLFHKSVSDQQIASVFAVMAANRRHTFQVLTKRAGRMSDWVREYFENHSDANMPRNIWLGVSVEDQDQYARVRALIRTPASVRFLSYEPALGSLTVGFKHLMGHNAIGWVIAGCESGPGRRPAENNWFRALRDQCVAAGVPFFLKQMDIGGKVVKLPPLDGCQWAEMPKRGNYDV